MADFETTIRAVVVGVDGMVTERGLHRPQGGTVLAVLQAAVGGDVACVSVTDSVDLWVCEDGLGRFAPNPVAVLAALYLRGVGGLMPYWGTAVFTGGADDDGDTLDAPTWLHAQVRQVAVDTPPASGVGIDVTLACLAMAQSWGVR